MSASSARTASATSPAAASAPNSRMVTSSSATPFCSTRHALRYSSASGMNADLQWAVARQMRMIVAKSAHHPPEQAPPCGRVLEEGDDQVAMPVEPCRSPDDRHHPIGQREVEERVDFGVGHSL